MGNALARDRKTWTSLAIERSATNSHLTGHARSDERADDAGVGTSWILCLFALCIATHTFRGYLTPVSY